MKIDDKIVDKLSQLARINFNKIEKEKIQNDLNRILDFVDKLNEVDTADIEPLVYMTDEVNVLRDDEVKNNLSKKEALDNAPEKDSDYFKVPKVLKK